MDKKSCGKVENKMFGSETNLKKKKYNDQNGRIVGGQESMAPMPWMVVHFVGENIRRSQRCGGSLINSQFVLTAAHCFCESKNQQDGPPSGVKLDLK